MNGWQPPNFLTFVKYLKYIGEIGTVYSKNWGNLLSSLQKLGKFMQFAPEDGENLLSLCRNWGGFGVY